MQRRTLLVSLLALSACATTQSEARDRAAIETLVRAEQQRAQRAWAARDASLMFDNPAAPMPSVRTPDGREIDTGAMRADVQRRMDMTVSVEEMSLEIGSITIDGDTATAVSHQRFVRTMRQPNGPRQRISTVTHTQTFARGADGKWAASGAMQESNQAARWADEPAPTQ